ncbi:MAG: MFS transporter, partial [Rhodospirillales bacterium]|nr:MFS transporter [Rhodospirillales bacterium]
SAFTSHFDRRRLLIVLDVVRILVAVSLPFVTAVWQVYVLIFVLQAASAAFTPTFQATIPEVLPKEADYTKALSLSRLAMDIETLVSPALATLLLLFFSFNYLFWGTALGFAGSAILIFAIAIPTPAPTSHRSVYDRMTRGISLYFRTPRLRGLLAMNWVASMTGAMVIVNTVIVIRGDLGMSQSAVGLSLASFGAGSMLIAIALPRLFEHFDDRMVMLTGAVVGIAAMVGLLIVTLTWGMIFEFLLASWGILGAGYSAILTPSGRLLTRSSHSEDRPSVFAAQFALSHACWLVSYPLAGFLITFGGTTIALVGLSSLALLGLSVAFVVWPKNEPGSIEHAHPELDPDHPHLQGQETHRHPIIIDDLHPNYIYPK